ncbi:hypothetical protein OAG1_17170 [Agarivorans sp. OAG1]|uniref:substrate-binding periplasmic protein n=1 Tax=Agarivorans sp. OAG1 TaxID=3082387 RepID=UPI002B28290E|nr:hypothetical protein OAG1_17170 [Agarivorans sp. OAG1]
MQRLFTLLCLYCFSLSCYAALDKLSYLTEDAYPINYLDQQGQAQGFAVELLKLMWQQMEHPEQAIKVMPWERAYYLLEQKPNTVLFATVLTAKRKQYFKWVCPIDTVSVVLLGKADSTPNIQSLEQLNELKVGVLRADVGEQLLLNNEVDDASLMLTDSYHHLIKLLVANRVDFIAGTEQTIRHAAKQNSYSLSNYEVKWLLNQEQLCYAFNQAVDDTVIEQFKQALKQVKETDAYQELLANYQQQKLKP